MLLLFFEYCLELDVEERVLIDGRIGFEVVGIDRVSFCGLMNINDGIEVYIYDFRKIVFFKNVID